MFWRCSGHAQGVLDTDTGVLDTDTGVLDTDTSVLDTDTSALDWTCRSYAGQTRDRRLNHPVMLGPDLAWVHTRLDQQEQEIDLAIIRFSLYIVSLYAVI